MIDDTPGPGTESTLVQKEQGSESTQHYNQFAFVLIKDKSQISWRLYGLC